MLTRFFTILTLCTLPLLLNAQNTFYQPNEFACAGTKVEMKCYVQAPSLETFSISAPRISFDESEPYTMEQINSDTVPDVDTSRYHVEQITTGNTRIGAKITISSFAATDSDVLFGCHGRYLSGTDTEALASGYPPKTPAVPDHLWSVDAKVLSVSYSCYAKVEISFLSSRSDAPIQYYELYVNGKLSDDHLDSITSFFDPATVRFFVVPAKTYKISVAAVSCAGTAAPSDTSDSGTFSIPSFELDSNLDFTLDDFNGLVINWSFQEKSDIAIAIGYNLKVDTAFTIGSESDILNQTLTFSQTSDMTSYTHDLGLSVITENEIHLATTVKLQISSQCYDNGYAGVAITASDDLVSKAAPLNPTSTNIIPTSIDIIPTSKYLVVVIVLALGLLFCSASTVILIILLINESSRRRSALRRQNYAQFVGADEQGEPLLTREEHPPTAPHPLLPREEPTFPAPMPPPGYSVST